ncbi:hypothetical protein N7490_007128 [Penicillium lividum]|nr:hypothetical protein N7490_007128 [Penicillium lividum]
MADENPSEVAEQPKLSPTDKSADKESDNTTLNAKPTENANADQKEPEVQADKVDASDDATKAQEEVKPASEDAEPAAPKTNGTPASKSKDQRRSSGVGEKKLNRKKSMNRIINKDVKPGQYYLSTLRSFAPWPSIVCDEEMIPQTLLDSRPVTAMQLDGKFRADYADDGRRAHERTYPIMFFGSNEFAWMPNNRMTPLEPADCKDISEKNKAKGLIAAYKVAAEGHDLKYFKTLLADHQAAIQQEIEEEEREEAEKAKAKADKKNRRKSKGTETDIEMEEADEAKPSKSTKKRKKDETDVEEDKPAKTPKTSTKLKLSTPKAPAEEKKKTPAPKAKKAAPKKGKAASDEVPVEAKEPEKQIDPEELQRKKEKEVLFLRHKLQKGFISRENPPQENEMDALATYYDKLEKHADLEVAIIRSTKINKVLKMIVKLNTIPRDEEFNFRSRAMSLLSQWKNVLDVDIPASTDKEDKPASNGAKEDEALETPAEEEKEESKADDTPMPDAESDKPEASREESEKSEEKAE